MIADAQLEDVRRRFGHKQANLASIVPSVAGPVLGGYLGKKYLGAHFGEDLGPAIGAITGGIGGRVLAEGAERAQQQSPAMAIPAGAPYALDPSIRDIPPWALSGAQILQPIMKQGGHLGDILGGDLGGSPYAAYDAYRRGASPGQIGKEVVGGGLGVVGGGLLGHGTGALINRLVGHEVNLPGNIPLSVLLAGAGAAAGNVKGLAIARGTQGA